MGRIRTIKPEFWKHEDLSELPEATHLLAAALLNYADDEGYFNANIALIKAECSPLREPSVSIHASLNQLSRIGYLRLGECENGRSYGQVVNFGQHQRVNRPTPSKIKELSIVWEGSVMTHTQLTEDSPPERKGREGNREQGTGSAHTRTVPPDWFPGEVLPGQARIDPGVDIERELLKFRAHTFQSPKTASQLQGEWVKWLNNARPRAPNSTSRGEQTTNALREFLHD